MEKAFKLDFVNDKTGSLYVNCCGCSQTAPLHSFGPASKPHYLIHYVLSGKGHFRFHDKEYRLEAGYGFLIQPNELAFYQADAKDPWSYLWVGFAGSRAEEYLHSMGLSDRHPIFSCDKSEELYSIVRDMMEHNTFGIADDLRRNGLLGVFLSVIADSAGVVAREEEDKGNQYVKKAVSFIQSNYCNPIKVTDVADYVCINRSYLYTLFQNYLGMSPQQFLTTFRITKARDQHGTHHSHAENDRNGSQDRDQKVIGGDPHTRRLREALIEGHGKDLVVADHKHAEDHQGQDYA